MPLHTEYEVRYEAKEPQSKQSNQLLLILCVCVSIIILIGTQSVLLVGRLAVHRGVSRVIRVFV